jgi:hypothetical protein
MGVVTRFQAYDLDSSQTATSARSRIKVGRQLMREVKKCQFSTSLSAACLADASDGDRLGRLAPRFSALPSDVQRKQ